MPTLVQDTQNSKLISAMYLDSAQTVAGDNKYDLVDFDKAEFDELGVIDISNSKFLIPSNRKGVYTISGHVGIDNLGQGNLFILALYKNSSLKHEHFVQGSTTNNKTALLDHTLRLAGDDEIEFYVKQNSGVNKDLLTGEDDSHMEITRLR